MLRLVYRAAALDDLDAIFDFIAADNPSRALDFIDAIRQRCRALCTYPELGPAREDLGTGIRIFAMLGRVVVAYRVGTKAIEITRVFSGGQDFEAIMGGGGHS